MWALKSGMCKSREAAAISVPAQLRFQPRQGSGDQVPGPEQQGVMGLQGEGEAVEQEQVRRGGVTMVPFCILLCACTLEVFGNECGTTPATLYVSC